jgi:putative transposase
MIHRDHPQLSLARQCALVRISRSSLYYQPRETSAQDLELMALMDRQYLKTPFYGSRRMTVWMRSQGHQVNRKHVMRLMGVMGLEAIYRRPNTSRPAPGHKAYPYLLKGREIHRVNQVWAADITYISLTRGFLYLVAIMDWHSRYVLAWRVSNTLEADFCIEALEEALEKGSRRSSTLTKAASSPARPSPASCWSRAFRWVWTAGAGAWTTSLWSGCGAASSMRRST